jgi:ribulose-phosphate 3-epimerase
MAMRIHLSPSLLAADTVYLGAAVRAVEAAGADSLHIDIMDGHYVANLAFSPKNVEDLCAFTRLPLHVHLEVDNPDQCIPLFRQASMIIVQEDTCPDLRGTIKTIRDFGIAVGVGVNPDRPVEAMMPFLADLELLLVMAVWPGFGGQRFDASVLRKATWAREQRKRLGLQFAIGLDGGVSASTSGAIVEAGVDFLIAGSSVFSNVPAADYVAAIKERIRQVRAPALSHF